MAQTHIITVEQLRKLGRPIGKMVSEDKLLAFITESEQLQVKPIIGDTLFMRIMNELSKDSVEDEKINLLLDGGTYRCTYYGKNAGADNDVRCFMGLRLALSYFVYAQYVMSGDVESTRYGLNIKNDEYSSHVSDKSRSNLYNNANEIGKGYMQECVAFCKISGLMVEQGKSKINMGGCTIKKIG